MISAPATFLPNNRFLLQSGSSLLVIWLVWATTAWGQVDQINLVDGEVLTGKVTGFSNPTGFQLENREQPVPLAEMRSLRRQVRGSSELGTQMSTTLLLTDGSQLKGSRFLFSEDNASLQLADGRNLPIPVDSVRAVQFRLNGPDVAANYLEQYIARIQDDADHLLVLDSEKRIQAMTGLIEEIRGDQILFRWQDSTRSVEMKNVFAVVIAPLGDPPSREGKVKLSLTDHSSVWVQLESLSNDSLSFKLSPEQPSFTVAWNEIKQIDVHNSRLQYLSDLEPQEVSLQALAVTREPYRRDLNIQGKPLLLRAQQFAKGLGTSSRSELRYECQGYELFLATIGIDDLAQGRGDCEFIVLVDGQEKFRQQVQGTNPAIPVVIDLSTAREISLIVEYGKDFDLADYANWCDARFVRRHP